MSLPEGAGFGGSRLSQLVGLVNLPPLIVTNEELDLGIAALDKHLGIADAPVG